MRIYIAYKFKNVQDKETLINNLENLEKHLINKGHNTFLLGHDVQNWHRGSIPLYKTIPHIIINILKSDVVLAYVNSEVSSSGLTTEMKFCKLFRKKLILCVQDNISYTDILPYLSINKQILYFTNQENLYSQIDSFIL